MVFWTSCFIPLQVLQRPRREQSPIPNFYQRNERIRRFNMRYHSGTERWDLYPVRRFLYTQVIFEENGKFFAARIQEREILVDCEDLHKRCDLVEIPVDHIYPLMETEFARLLDLKKPGIFIKGPRISAKTRLRLA